MVTKIELGEKIKVQRNIKGLTQESVAEMLKISPTAFAKIEQGKTDVNFSRLVQISKALETTISRLLELGENGYYNMSENQNSNFIVSPSSNDVILEMTKLRGENDSLKKEVAHLSKIVELLEGRTH
jgi:transcriptional regulator with XRE-family HTH domain